MATIITRETGVDAKGSPLTNEEVDNNFINLKTESEAAVKKAGDTMTGDLALPSASLDTTLANPTYTEGKFFYDNVKKALSYYNDASDVTVNIGQEVLLLVENQTGGTLTNGTVVAPDATTIITPADAYYKDKSRVLAVLTHDIANGAMGYATKLGQVGGLDTSMYTPGQTLYLGSAGAIVTAPPLDGGYAIIIGVCDIVDPTDGVITVDTSVSELTVEVTDTNGFPPDQRTGTTLSADDSTRTLTITPTGADFHFYERGDKYEKNTAESVIWDDLEGEHWIYYIDGVLTSQLNPPTPEKQDIITNHAFVCTIYWNATAKARVLDIQEERHGISMTPATHIYLHQTRGAQFSEGMGLGDMVVDGSGNLDTEAQFSIAEGTYFDEDLVHNLAAVASTTGLPVVYNAGASGVPRVGTQAGFSVLNAPAGRLYWNEWNGASWQLTEVTNNDFVLYHVFATNNLTNQFISIMGQNKYNTRNAARNAAPLEVATLLGQLPFPEFIPIATIIYQTGNGYGNAVKAKIVSTDTGDDYVDWRVTELAQGVTPSSHANLTNVDLAASGISQGHIDDQAQTIAGLKTFETRPITTEAATDLGTGIFGNVACDMQGGNAKNFYCQALDSVGTPITFQQTNFATGVASEFTVDILIGVNIPTVKCTGYTGLSGSVPGLKANGITRIRFFELLGFPGAWDAEVITAFEASAGGGVLYVTSDPTKSTNPASNDVLYVNTVTGEAFSCIDLTTNNNKWVGQRGTYITPDADFSKVTLLLPFSGSEGSTFIIDRSNYRQAAIANGDAHISEVIDKFGGSSCYFDGAGDYLALENYTGVGFGTGPFTLECWCYPTDLSGTDKGLIDFRTGTAPSETGGTFFLDSTASYALAFWNNTSKIGGSGSAPTLNAWNHVALSFDGTTMRGFLNGVLQWSGAHSKDLASANNLGIGGGNQDVTLAGGSPYTGYLDDVRITKGVARYLTNFTPPTTAF